MICFAPPKPKLLLGTGILIRPVTWAIYPALEGTEVAQCRIATKCPHCERSDLQTWQFDFYRPKPIEVVCALCTGLYRTQPATQDSDDGSLEWVKFCLNKFKPGTVSFRRIDKEGNNA